MDQKPSRGWSILKVLLLLIAGAGSLLGLLFIAALFMVTSSGGCGNKARQSEVKQNVGSMNRGQQAFYLEHGRFSKSVKALGLGIQTQTYNYQYLTQGTKTAAFSYGIARNDQVKSYVGATFLLPETGQSNKTKSEPWMVTVLCEANRFGVYQPANPTLQKGTPTCPEGTKTIETR
ncbi:hypothetical protein BST81_03900 [Leptolyngbya sp. 'hensonii']|nr:hypothetical protein BST81_03900 [Leptolyngbya sp. 'hensonii']